MAELSSVFVKIIWAVSAIFGLIVVILGISHAVLMGNRCKIEETKDKLNVSEKACIAGIVLATVVLVLGAAQLITGVLNLAEQVDFFGLGSQHVGFLIVCIVVIIYQIVMQQLLAKDEDIDWALSPNDLQNVTSYFVFFKPVDVKLKNLPITIPLKPFSEAVAIFSFMVVDCIVCIVITVLGCVLTPSVVETRRRRYTNTYD